jgi:hypothetical protein
MWHLEETGNAGLDPPWPERPAATGALGVLGALRLVEATHHHLFATHFGMDEAAQWTVGAQLILGAGCLALVVLEGFARPCQDALIAHAAAECFGVLAVALTCGISQTLWPLVAVAATCHNIFAAGSIARPRAKE